MNDQINITWNETTIYVDKGHAENLLSALKEGGVDASAEGMGICSNEQEIETIRIPEHELENAKRIVRNFTSGK